MVRRSAPNGGGNREPTPARRPAAHILAHTSDATQTAAHANKAHWMREAPIAFNGGGGSRVWAT